MVSIIKRGLFTRHFLFFQFTNVFFFLSFILLEGWWTGYVYGDLIGKKEHFPANYVVVDS